MIEGQFTKKSEESAGNRDVLHKFRWTELVAKLSATRELREELAKKEHAGFQAFGEARRETEMSASLESRLRAMARDRHVLRDTGA